jgi:pilus assembly protein Flp/PilA
MQALYHVVRDRTGATAIEYGLIATFLAIGLLASMQGLRNQLLTTFNTTSSAFAAAF